jgi:D-tyrosyl-tRNA(Tyr) deacylase
VLLGIGRGDTEDLARRMARKTAELRIFSDPKGKFNLSVLDICGEVMVVSQFTLYADCRRGRRPSFTDAAPPELALPLVNAFVDEVGRLGLSVSTGVFQAHMLVELQNDGPVTVLLDSSELFGLP